MDSRIEPLADAVVARLRSNVPVALGFECPMFIPVRDKPEELAKARQGDLISWSSSVGASALATGLVQLTWLLRELRSRLEHPPQPFFR